MTYTAQTDTQTRFAFFLIPGFSLVALSCAVDTLRAANVELGSERFSWQLTGIDPQAPGATEITSSSGLPLAILPCAQVTNSDIVVVCGGERSHLYHCIEADHWLRRQAVEGHQIGSVSDGAFILAAAGLFDNCRSTIHWKCQLAYREQFPDLDIRPSILEIDGNRFSCAGGTASLDLILQFVRQFCGTQVADKIADNYFHDVIRGEDQIQPTTSSLRFSGRDSVLSNALQLMETHLESPLSIGEIADRLGTSDRHLDRLFVRHLEMPPSTFYRELRLKRASGLLKQSQLSVSEIAVGCGFHSASHLARHFRRRFGEAPLRHRRAR